MLDRLKAIRDMLGEYISLAYKLEAKLERLEKENFLLKAKIRKLEKSSYEK